MIHASAEVGAEHGTVLAGLLVSVFSGTAIVAVELSNLLSADAILLLYAYLLSLCVVQYLSAQSRS